MDWFLYDIGLRRERVNMTLKTTNAGKGILMKQFKEIIYQSSTLLHYIENTLALIIESDIREQTRNIFIQA